MLILVLAISSFRSDVPLVSDDVSFLNSDVIPSNPDTPLLNADVVLFNSDMIFLVFVIQTIADSKTVPPKNQMDVGPK